MIHLEVKRNIIKGDKEAEQLCADVEYYGGTSLHDEDVKQFLRIKTPQWRHEGVLKEQASLIEDMDSYFKKWREWRNIDLGNKFSTSIK